MRFARVLGGLVVLALGIAVIVLARRLPYHAEYGPGPGFLPTWIGVALAACAAVVTVQELRARDIRETFFQPRTRRAAGVLLMIAVSFLLFPLLGIAVGFGAFVCATMRAMGRHRWTTCGAAAVLTAITIHVVFGRWLDIPLPVGLVGW